MSDLTTRYAKRQFGGWGGETVVPLPFQIEGKPAQLRLSTHKVSGGSVLVSYAGAQTTDNGLTTTRVFRDFHAVAACSITRCTEKAVRTQHEAVVADAGRWAAHAFAHHQELGDIA